MHCMKSLMQRIWTEQEMSTGKNVLIVSIYVFTNLLALDMLLVGQLK